MTKITDEQIRRAAKQAGIPYQLFRAVVGKESGGDPGAVSPAGARGAAQLMPGTAAGLEKRYGIKTSTPYGNLLGGAYYLAEQKKTFKTWRKALAAYNAGPGAVKEYGGVPPYPETEDYVDKIMGQVGAAKLGSGSVNAVVGPTVRPDDVGRLTQTGATVDPLQEAGMTGLRDLAEGDYNPMRQLQVLTGARAAQKAQEALPAPQTPPKASQAAPGVPVSPQGGLTYKGEATTHATSGLSGYPAVDLFADPGTPFLAPESGRVVRLSGRGGTKGGYYGWSVYFQGDSGKRYYIQHLNRQRAKKGRYDQGAVLGTVSAWKDGAPHAHVGVKGGKK